MSLPALLAVALGGASGTLLRLWIVARLASRSPIGTLAVNWLGCGLFGLLVPLGAGQGWIAAGLLVGFCGSLTTFSAFALDAVQLWRSGGIVRAAAYVLLTVGGGLAWMGLAWKLS